MHTKSNWLGIFGVGRAQIAAVRTKLLFAVLHDFSRAHRTSGQEGRGAEVRCASKLFEMSQIKLTLAMVSIDLVGTDSDMIHVLEGKSRIISASVPLLASCKPTAGI